MSVDGNVERVVARLFAVDAPLPGVKPELETTRRQRHSHPASGPATWAQAMMDLGAVICRPKAPLCDRCPLTSGCAAFASGTPDAWPRRDARTAKPRRYGVAYVLERLTVKTAHGAPPRLLVRATPALPTSDWRAKPWSGPSEAGRPAASVKALRAQPQASIEHVFTHFALTLAVRRARPTREVGGVIWSPREDLQALPSVFLKAARAAL